MCREKSEMRSKHVQKGDEWKLKGVRIEGYWLRFPILTMISITPCVKYSISFLARGRIIDLEPDFDTAIAG